MSEKAIFLDRDNTLIHDPGYINNPDQVKLLEGIPGCLKAFQKLGYKLVVVTNQSAVARGIITEEVLAQIHDRLKELLHTQGITLDRIYYCPFHPDGVVEKYRKASDWRKPNPGMLLAAAQDLGIDLERSWCIGNSSSDVAAGAKVGCKTILVNQMSPVNGFSRDQVKPDYMAVNMREALNIVKKYAHEVRRPQPAQTTPELPVKEEEEEEEEVTQPVSLPEPEPPTEVPEAMPVALPDVAATAGKADSEPGETDQLLREIISQLKAMQRETMFDEFSLVRLMAGITQTAVPFCLLIALWFLLTVPRRYEPVFTALGFAFVLQVMSLTLHIHGRDQG